MRLFLNIRDFDGLYIEDPDGQEFETLEKAQAEAAASARDMMAEALRSNTSLGLDRAVELKDEAGQVVLTVTFRESVLW